MRVLGLYPWSTFWALGPGKGANSFFLSVHAYVRRGHEMYISMPYARGLPRREDDHGIQIERFRGAIRFDSNPARPMPVRLVSRAVRYAYYYVLATWAGVRMGRKVQPDLVIGYGVQAAAAASLVARILGRPNVTRLFGLQLHLYLKNRWKLPGAFMDIFGLKARTSYVIIHDDGSQGDQIALRFGVPPEKLRFWRDGLECDLYRPGESFPAVRQRLGIPADHLVLFCVGRLGDDKKMGRLVEILPEVLREEPRVSLMLVGDGPDRPHIEKQVRALGLEAHVFFTGAVSREDLPQYLNLGEIFVGVSDRTNANLSPVEAMSCAKALVVLDTGGTRTLVEQGRSGVLIAPDRWREDLPSELVRLIRDPERRAVLGRGARERVQQLIPTAEQRQRMEVELGEQAVREFEAARRDGRGRRPRSG